MLIKFVIKCFHIALASCSYPYSFLLYTCVRGTVHAKKPAKVLLFFDMTKLFRKKMHFFCFFYEFSCFGGTYSPSDLYEMGYCAYKTGLCPKSKKMHLLHLPLYFGGNPLAGRAEIFCPSALEIFCSPFPIPLSSFVRFRAMLSPALSPPFPLPPPLGGRGAFSLPPSG